MQKGRAGCSGAPFLEGQVQIWFARLAMADFLFAAWLAWITPLLAALSSLRLASRSSSAALVWSPESAASRNLRIAVFTEDLTDLLRRRAFSFVLIRLIWDLMFATLNCSSMSITEGRARIRVAPREREFPPGRNATRARPATA